MAAIGEVLDCRREPSNPEDRYAFAVIKNKTITGHLPRKVSRLCSLFAKEIIAEGMESVRSGNPSLALRNFLRDIHLGFPIYHDHNCLSKFSLLYLFVHYYFSFDKKIHVFYFRNYNIIHL